MKLSIPHKLKIQVEKIFWITIVWTIISVFQFFAGLITLRRFNCDIEHLDPMIIFRGSIMTGILAGVLGGSGLVFLWEKWLRNKTYGTALFYIFWTFIIIYLMVAVPTGLYLTSHELGLPLFSSQNFSETMNIIFSTDQLVSFVFWLSTVLGTLIVLQVLDKYGPGVFTSFLLGRYFHPHREERIFMFLDLRSSTTIAEKLGEERNFNFIKDVFKDSTPAILTTKGEIYQYVGDEIVVSWKVAAGTENANCLNCFFKVQNALHKKREYYKSKYDGIIPEFKAGLHYGHVMAGEVGVVKRDIAYSGDVLNTTARIQSKCNEMGVNLLLSKYLLDKLSFNSIPFNPVKLGEMELRGKHEKVLLYTV